MEEVDNIILHTLRQIGCDIPEEVASLRDFSTENIVNGAAKCLHLINDEIQVSSVVPASMSARFRLGTTLASACQEVGYRGEIGYQTFLYSNEADIRKVFMFLVEKLPKESSASASEQLGTSVLLNRRIASEVSKHLVQPWTPSFCKKDGLRWHRTKPRSWQREGTKYMRKFHAWPLRIPSGLGDLTVKLPKGSQMVERKKIAGEAGETGAGSPGIEEDTPVSPDMKMYYSSALPFITSQPPCRQDVAPSVLESNVAAVTAATEWENEWNNSGLASRLSKEEYLAQKRDRMQKKIKQHLLSELQRAHAGGRGNSDLGDLVASFSDRTSGAGPTKGSRFTRAEKLQFGQDEEKTAAMAGLSEEGAGQADTEEELQRKRQEEIEQLQSQLSELTTSVDNMEVDIKTYSAGLQQTNEKISTQKTQNSEREDAYKVKKRTMDLLPDAENNITKLQGVVDASSQRLVHLAQQWEKHRAPLVDDHRQLKVLNANRVSETQKKLEEIKRLRETMKDAAEEGRGKDDLQKQLAVEYEKMVKDVNRSAYTRRIMEIIGNIKKQKEEISKILVDTKDVQKEINQLSGKLSRIFSVTDELIFRDAKKDEACRKAYKYLASLHENCKELIQSVEETGVVMREIRDLEEQIDMESQKNTSINLERITADYKQMKEENTVLTKKLKALKS